MGMLTGVPNTLVCKSHVSTSTNIRGRSRRRSKADLILTATLIIVPGPGDVRHALLCERFVVKQIDRLHGSDLLHNAIHSPRSNRTWATLWGLDERAPE